MLPVLLAQADTAVDAMTAVSEADLNSAIANLQSSADAAAAGTAGAGVLLGGLAILWGVLALAGLIFLIWWIVLLVDLSKRDFPQKTTYLVLMILSFFFGFIVIMDLVYYFAIVRNNVGTKKA